MGAKYYALHEGPALGPQEESDPRVLSEEPNFYYPQEDILKEFANKHGVGWNTTRPSHVIGAVPDAAMNFCYPLAIYATVQNYLGRPLAYPGDPIAWDQTVTLSSAEATGYLGEWIVLTDGARNESFNSVDGCLFTWSKFWPKLAERFSMPWTGPDLSDNAVYQSVTFPTAPPKGHGPHGGLGYSFQLVEWAKQAEVQEAWERIARAHGLRDEQLRDIDRSFGFTDTVLTLTYPVRLR